MRPALLVLATTFLVTQAHAQADSTAPDVFHKVTDSTHQSQAGSDIFRRASQAKDAAEGRPDVIATDPNQVEAQVVRRDSVPILHRAPAVAAVAPPAPISPTPSAPVSPAVAALGAAFTAAGPPDEPKPAAAPKPRRAPVSNGSIAKKAPPPESVAPPVEHASVVASGAAPMPTRMGAMPAPAAPPKAVFNDTLSTLQREAANVSEDVAPRYAAQKATMDSVRNKHNARLDSLEATESAIKDSTERRFEHKMAEAARLKVDTTHHH